MAARNASKATRKKSAPAKAGAKSGAKAGSTRARRQAADDPQARIAALEAERDRLVFELDTANERVRSLLEREANIIRRIDSIAESLHNLLHE
jgi:hypothetical protein